MLPHDGKSHTAQAGGVRDYKGNVGVRRLAAIVGKAPPGTIVLRERLGNVSVLLQIDIAELGFLKAGNLLTDTVCVVPAAATQICCVFANP